MASENLYIVKRSKFDARNPTQPVYDIALPATFTNLNDAKQYAKRVLPKEGYDIKFFPVYDVKDLSLHWAHEDGVMVYAEGPSGEVFRVEIDTVPNTAALRSTSSTSQVAELLYHVVQTLVDYNNDRSGSQRYSIVEGTYTSFKAARDRALQVLLDGGVKKEDFVEYDEYLDTTGGLFGPDVVVRAVHDGGLNVLVSVISSVYS
ncbi:unnamed protein product [Alternaria sp. RS040]